MEPKKSSNELGFRRWQQSKRKTSKDMALPITIPISQIPTQVRMTGTSSSIDLPLSSSINSSLFHSRLKTFLFRKSFPPQLSFLPRDAMHPRYQPWPCVCLSVCPSVCPSQVGVLLKRLNVGSHKQHHTIPQRLQFSDAEKISAKFDRGHSLRGRQMQVGWVKIGDFRQIAGYISKTVNDRHIFC